ncbi:MAG: hypothetical protein JJ863_15555 [Deltaproteobacteria bacterium]|nr:hypothetical protein [Deltaproteobacteria bacterium]
MTERTMVTGSPTRTPTPLRGQVIAERYEIRAQLRNDVFSLGMLAFDQESEDRVVLRIVRPELLDATGRAETYRALRKASGTGGRFLPGLLDVDKDGEYVFAVEPIPEGASLRDVLDARIASGEPMTEGELLPLVSHLETALAAVPPPLRHGDVRADHVWVDPHRLWLLGAFVVPALPVGAVAALLQKDSGLRRRMAPEVLRGIASDAADRYGVGAIVYEAMTLKTPPEPGEAGELPPTPVGEEVRALIHPDPGLRAKSLDPLVDALAKASGLAVPELDPGTFRAPKRLSVPRPGSVRPKPRSSTPPESIPPSATQPDAVLDGDTQQMSALSDSDAAGILDAETAPGGMRGKRLDPDDGLPPPPVISDDAGTKRFPIDTTKPPKPSETAKLTPLSKRRAKEELEARVKTAGLDPRLVRAALDRTASAGHQDEEGQDGPPSREPDSIDPRLVRAALGIQHIDSSEDEVPLDPSVPAKPAKDGTQEISFDELEAADDDEDEVPLDPSVPAKPAKEGTQELRLDELEVEEMEEEEEVELDPSVPAQPRKEGTQELRLEDLEVQVGADDEQVAMRAPRAPARDVGLADLEEMRRRREAVPREGVKRMPRPRKDSLVGMKGPVLFDDSSAPKPQPMPQPVPVHAPAPVPQVAPQVAAVPQVAPQVAAVPAAPRAPRLDADAGVIVKPPSEPPARPTRTTERPGPAVRAPRERNWGAIIIVVSLLLGAVIIIGSFAYARYQKTQAEEERRQRIQDRIERMRGETQ